METHRITFQKNHSHSHDIRDPRYMRAESLANFGFFEVDLLWGISKVLVLNVPPHIQKRRHRILKDLDEH